MINLLLVWLKFHLQVTSSPSIQPLISIKLIHIRITRRAAQYSKINLDIVLSCPNTQDNIVTIFIYSFRYNMKIAVLRM